MGRGYVEKPEDVVTVGDEIQVQIVGIDRRRGRVDLSMKELLPPVQESPVHETSRVLQAVEAGFNVVPDDDAFVSPFEMALQEASSDRADKRRERKKKTRTYEFEDDEEEDIIFRTIAHHRKSKGL